MVNDIRGNPAQVEIVVADGARRIQMRGECDLSVAEAAGSALRELLDAGQRSIVFDLQEASFLDSSILGIFLQARRAVAANGGEVVLLCRPGFIRRLLTLLELDRLLRVCSAEEWRRHLAQVH